MSLRIAMVGACPYPAPQGSQAYLRDTALTLQRRGHAVHVVVYGYGVGEDRSGLVIHRCRRFPGDATIKAGPSWMKPLLDAAMVMTLRRVVRQEKIDVVCAHNYEALLVALAVGKRPIIYHAHNAMGDELPQYFRWKRVPEAIGRWLDLTFPRRADWVVSPHRRLAGYLVVRGCVHDRVSVVAPALDVELFEAGVIRKETPPVLYAGNLDAYQNLGLLYAAMKCVQREIPEAKLKISTAVDAEIEGAEIIPTAGLGALSRVLFEDSVFAVPRVSWSGYPIKLLNAMAAGKAIVACKGAAYPLTHEVNGLIVDGNDEQAFADALLRLLRDRKLRAKLGKAARETIAREHKSEVVGEQLEGIALNLLGKVKGA